MDKESAHEASKRVLVLDGGEAPYSLTIVRALGSVGYAVDLGFQYGSRIFEAYSRYSRNYLFYPDPLFFEEDFKTLFQRLSGRYDFIIPTMEKTQICISSVKDYVEGKGTTVPIPPLELLKTATNKGKMIDVCRNLKIAVPKTITPSELPEIKEIIQELGLPFIIKSASEIDILAGPGRRYFVVKRLISQAELRSRYKQIAELGPPIIQEYVQGVGVGVSFIFSKRNKLISYFGHRRILERYPEGGPSIIAETYYHPEAVAEGYRLLTSLKWQGVAMTEFKLSPNGKLYFMEINPRFWGTLPLAIASGINFPKLLVDNYNSSKANLFQRSRVKKKIMVRLLTPYLFAQALKSGNTDFAKKIAKSSLSAFDHGLVFITDLEKLDFLPSIKKVSRELYASTGQEKIAKIGNLYFGPYKSAKEISKHDIHTVVDLREKQEKILQGADSQVKVYNFPIPDDSAPNLKSLILLISNLQAILTKESVYIHCRIGRGRAPMVVLSYLIATGLPIGKAYSMVYEARPYTFLNSIQKRTVYQVYRYYKSIRHIESKS
jgi:protein-tyrosine phosphatase